MQEYLSKEDDAAFEKQQKEKAQSKKQMRENKKKRKLPKEGADLDAMREKQRLLFAQAAASQVGRGCPFSQKNTQFER